MENQPDSQRYNCYSCDGFCTLDELLKVDNKLKKMDPEEHEFLLDELKKSNGIRKIPFTHMSDLGYEVLNICPTCYIRAKHVLFRDE